MVGSLGSGTVWTADDRGRVVCRARDRSRGSARLRFLECCRNCQLSRLDRVLTRGEVRRRDHDDDYVVARVLCHTRAAKQTIAAGGILCVRWFVTAGEGPRGDCYPIWRRRFVLLIKTRLAVAICMAEFVLGCAASVGSLRYLVWTSHRAARLDVY